MADDTAIELEAINLSQFADPDVEAILIRIAAAGSDARLAAIKDELRREERRGWCSIILMDDDLAVVRWHDQFVLTLNERAPVQTGGRDV